MNETDLDLWVEKYRPKSLKDYVWKDVKFKKQIEELVKNKKIPHILLSGSPGVGKTTLAKVLLNELGVDSCDVLMLNGSVDNGIDVIRERITNFVTRLGFSSIRYVIFDEADYLTQNAQASMRNLMETYSDVSRFILTANYPHKIIPAIKSRCQHFSIQELDKESFIERIIYILEKEEIEFTNEILVNFIEYSYPDLRKCINLLQQYSVDKKLLEISNTDNKENLDWYKTIVCLFKEGKINEARKFIIENVSQEEYEDIYRFLYDNLDIYCKNENRKLYAILTIREGLVNHTICADPEINLSATLVKLLLKDKGI